MDPAAQLYYATAAFLATHFVSSTPLRTALVKRIGEKPYVGLYTLVAFATLGWMIWAYAKAPPEPGFAAQYPYFRWLPAVAMPLAFILMVCGVLGRNPTLVGAEKLLRSEEPARGMIRITRHPLMWGLMLWSLAHLLASGDRRASIFFGGMLALAALGSLLIDQRKRGTLGEDWKRFEAVTSYVPFGAILQGRNRLVWREIGWRNPAIGLALYGVVFWLHPVLFKARPY